MTVSRRGHQVTRGAVVLVGGALVATMLAGAPAPVRATDDTDSAAGGEMADTADLASEAPILGSETDAPVRVAATPRRVKVAELGNNGQLRIRLKGERFGRKATIRIRGISGKAKGVRRNVKVGRRRTVSGLPPGRYRIAGKKVTYRKGVALANQAEPFVVVVKKGTRAGTSLFYRRTRNPKGTRFPVRAWSRLKRSIRRIAAGNRGQVGVALQDVASGRRILLGASSRFHTASTFKTFVMIEAYRRDRRGTQSLDDRVRVTNRFSSIVDGSPYWVGPSGGIRNGSVRSIRELVYSMITVSSNLAANNLVVRLTPRRITRTVRRLGATGVRVRRPVLDMKAHRRGINNTARPRDYLKVFRRLARGKVVSVGASAAMIDTLLDQRLVNTMPKYLPRNARVANKPGSLSTSLHDTGIVMLPDGRQYVLAMLSQRNRSARATNEVLARISKRIYDFYARR